MSIKKLDAIISLLEICETNLKNVKLMLNQITPDSTPSYQSKSASRSQEEQSASKVVEGYFDGENMIGDDGKAYIVPQNYASKSQLVMGDRMKWILTKNHFGELQEVYKLTQPVPRERVIGKFLIDGNNYVVMIEGANSPVKILKASATYAMKNLGLKIGDNIAIYVPKNSPNPTWGAFLSVVTESEAANYNYDMPYEGRKIIYNGEDEIDPQLDDQDENATQTESDDFVINENINLDKGYF